MDKRLQPFVGSWEIEVIFPEGGPVQGDVGARATFEWILDSAFLVERSEVDHPDAPNGFCIIAPKSDGDGYTQHYFDSRGVARLYDMTFDGRVWTLTRTKPDFTPLEFEQRYIGTFSEGGRTIAGAWEIHHPGQDWRKDFDMNYRRS